MRSEETRSSNPGSLLRLFLTPHSLLLTLLLAQPVAADQYRSEQRVIETPASPPPQQDPQKLLESAKDPYTRALILRDMAAAAVEKKNYPEAVKLLEQAIAAGGLSGIAADELKRNLAQLYIAAGNYKKVLPQLEQQAKAANAPPETLIALAGAYLDGKRYKEAIPLLQRGIAASRAPDPSWKRALLSAYLGSGMEKEALPLLEQAVRDDPRDREAWLRLCALTLKFGSKERALAYLELAQRLGFIDSEKDRLRLVQLTAQIGAPFQAGSLLQLWMEGKQLDNNAENWKLLANLWVNAREKKLALAALEEAISRAPSAQLFLTQGQLLMEREEYSRAERSLEQAIALGGKTGPALMSVGMARYQQADVDGALGAFRDARQYPQSAKPAAQWVAYLEKNEARSEAMRAVQEQRRRQQEETVQLAGQLLGGSVRMAHDQDDDAFYSPFQKGSGAGGAGGRVAAGGGDPLTPVGADRPGNADGSIPPWTGGMQPSEKPAAFTPGGKLVNPFPNDRPQFTITGANADQYAAHLSRGHLALLKKYPGYSLPVYATRRTASFPQAIYDATQRNFGSAKLIGADALTGAKLGFPFPQPKSGVEIMWNHRVRYRGDTVAATYSQAVVDGKQLRQRNKETFKIAFKYGSIKNPVDIAKKNILVYGITYISEGPRGVDYVALFHETANSLDDPRKIWVLVTKIHRMLRIPPVGYDQPFPGSEGIEFIDMVDMYNGAFDRYVWKLSGKREIYIPYNDYRASDGSFKNEQLLTPNFFNPQATRYELHRCWVIEAEERGGKHHAFGKRTFYVDEDSWNVVMVENEDRNGNLWRFQEGHMVQLYDVQAMTAVPTLVYDLKDGRYFANRLFSEDKGFQYNLEMKDADFLPATVQAVYSH